MSERTPPPAPGPPPKASRRKRRLLFLGLAILVPLVALVVIGSVLMQGMGWSTFRQSSGIMRPGLLLDDYLVIDTRAYVGDRRPAYGDIIAFTVPRNVSGLPGAGPPVDLTMRVVGLPGDQVKVAGGAVAVNGAPLPQEPLGEVVGAFPGKKVMRLRERAPNGVAYEIMRVPGSPDSADLAGSYTVPPGHYFVLGDNRDDSLDSRFWAQRGWYLPAGNIRGAATYIYWSGVDRLDRIGTALK